MNHILTGVLLISVLTVASPAVPAASDPQDEAAIKTTIESIGILADQGNFEEIEKLYADEVELDYTSLTGGEVERISPQALMTQWASVLPGFDRTRHAISDIAVTLDGTGAEATANVIADHYVGDLFWQVRGTTAMNSKKPTGYGALPAIPLTCVKKAGPVMYSAQPARVPPLTRRRTSNGSRRKKRCGISSRP